MTGNRSLPESRVPESRDAPPAPLGDHACRDCGTLHGIGAGAHLAGDCRYRIPLAGPLRGIAGRHGVPAAFGSFEELAASDVDIIYVATPHNFHQEAALMAFEAGKHVLVESSPRIFDPALAGGPLLGHRTYPLSLITSILGEPDRLLALGEPHESGVNAQLWAVMSFAGGRQAMVNTQLPNFTPTSATIVGTEASLTIDGPFNMPGVIAIRFPEGTRPAYEEPAGAQVKGLHNEAAAVARAISAGHISPPAPRHGRNRTVSRVPVHEFTRHG